MENVVLLVFLFAWGKFPKNQQTHNISSQPLGPTTCTEKWRTPQDKKVSKKGVTPFRIPSQGLPNSRRFFLIFFPAKNKRGLQANRSSPDFVFEAPRTRTCRTLRLVAPMSLSPLYLVSMTLKN